MSNSPFIGILRSLNYTNIVSGLSDNIVSSYDGMKLPKMANRIHSLEDSLTQQISSCEQVLKFSNSNNLSNLDSMIKEINSFYDEKFSEIEKQEQTIPE